MMTVTVYCVSLYLIFSLIMTDVQQLLAVLGCIPTVAAEICTKSNGLLANEKTCECDGLTCDISTGSSYCYSAGGASFVIIHH